MSTAESTAQSTADSTGESITQWYPAQFSLGPDERSLKPSIENPYQVLVLNQPIKNKSLLLKICENAIVRACADGGANHFRDLGLTEGERDRYHIDIIVGDFDSCRPEVESHYQSLGARIVKDSDQYSTDLMKSINILRNDSGTLVDGLHEPPDSSIDIAIFGSLSGRADQAFSQLHQLYLMARDRSSMIAGKAYFITPESIIFLLEVGLNRIHTPVDDAAFTQTIGIIPLAKPAVITTRGLEWDVSAWPTEFGGQISTSNHIMESTVEVETTEPILFTLEYAQKPEK